MRVLDWLARTTMLVLAALATLALIGSLASVSDSSLGKAFPGRIEPPSPAPPPSEIGESVEASSPATEQTEVNSPASTTVTRVASPPVERENEIARWLKALTYAVLALAAVAAAGVIALVRIGGHLARVAER